VATVCGKCGGELVQRADDNEEVVRERLKVYERATKPLVEFYRERPTFRVVNGAQPQDRVAHELDTVIEDAALASAKVEKVVTEKVATPEKAART
jgi:adenylate kinase